MDNNDTDFVAEHKDASELEQIHLLQVQPHEEQGTGSWYLSRDNFAQLQDTIKNEKDNRKLTTGTKAYYKQQEETLAVYLEEESPQNETSDAKLLRWVDRAAKASLAVNVVLLVAKAVAAALSDSLAIISSVVDSAVDLVSGSVLWYAGKKMREVDVYHYPQGRSRLEPVAIVILSCIMAMASVTLIREAVQQMVTQTVSPDVSVPTLGIIGGTILLKTVLFLYCRRLTFSPSAAALATDHRNDILSNSFAAIFGALGKYVWKYADPIGAILISIYIFVNWWRTGSVVMYEPSSTFNITATSNISSLSLDTARHDNEDGIIKQIRALTGHVAPPHLIRKLAWVCLQHSNKIDKIDTVRAYRFGNNYLAEVDIVLHENLTLREAHDVGEPLQLRLESLPEIERAFVHLDYEVDHSPADEHKQVWNMKT